jgi:hypothetical protein
LEWLDQPIQQNAVKTAVTESDVTLMMLVESLHASLLCGELPGA